MSPQSLGRTLVIANPTAHSGKGEGAAVFATRFFSSFHSATSSCEVRLTENAGDAQRMASDAFGYHTVLALGGDGVIHEVINGLMLIPEDERPRLGIIPMGSGNDFARTLGMTKNDAERSIAELLSGEERTIDLGNVNGVYFMQTLSFGLDAAIAIDTTNRRANNTTQAGATLYATSGIKILVTGFRGWPYHAVVDGEPIEGIDLAFAVQNGPTYGGGFRICPSAVPNDGYLDLCLTVSKPSLPRSLALFGLIRFGKHTKSRALLLKRIHHVEVSFDGEEQPPCQVDGEQLSADKYDISVVSNALRVIVPSNCTW